MEENTIQSIEQAVSVLIQGVKIGQTKGAYSLEDAAMLSQAIKMLSKKEQPQDNGPEPLKPQKAPRESIPQEGAEDEDISSK